MYTYIYIYIYRLCIHIHIYINIDTHKHIVCDIPFMQIIYVWHTCSFEISREKFLSHIMFHKRSSKIWMKWTHLWFNLAGRVNQLSKWWIFAARKPHLTSSLWDYGSKLEALQNDQQKTQRSPAVSRNLPAISWKFHWIIPMVPWQWLDLLPKAKLLGCVMLPKATSLV